MTPKTPQEIAIMAEGGAKLGAILERLLDDAQVGVSLHSLEKKAVDAITKAGGTPSFMTVPGYKWATCLCVNEGVVHCIPTDYVLKDGDILTIDIGMLYQGLHTDTAWSKIVGTGDSKKQTFLAVGEEALWKAIGEARADGHIGRISKAIQDTIEGAGYSIVKTLVGHGVGKDLHEEPQIPGFVRGPIEQTPKLVAGQTIAVEVIYAMGKGIIVYEDDGWTLTTRDRSLSAVFEHTIAITKEDSPIVLTRSSLSAPQGEPSIKE